DGQVVISQTPLTAQDAATSLRMEQLTVNSPAETQDSFESEGLQTLAKGRTGDQGSPGSVVEPAQIAKHYAVQMSDTTVPRITMEIGVKATEHRNGQAARDTNGRPTQRTFSGDVDDVRAIAHPQLPQQRSGRQAELQTLVSWQRQTGDHRDAPVKSAAIRPVLSGTYY